MWYRLVSFLIWYLFAEALTIILVNFSPSNHPRVVRRPPALPLVIADLIFSWQLISHAAPRLLNIVNSAYLYPFCRSAALFVSRYPIYHSSCFVFKTKVLWFQEMLPRHNQSTISHNPLMQVNKNGWILLIDELNSYVALSVGLCFAYVAFLWNIIL